MSIFGYTTEATTEVDRLGADFSALPTNVYPLTIAVAYTTPTKSGGTALNIIFKDGDREVKKTLYVTSTKSGTEKNTYMDKEGKPVYLADFLHADAMALLAAGKPLSQLTVEDKMVKIFDFDQKKEVPKKVPTFPELQGKTVKVALLRVKKIKQVKQGDEYVDSDEIREENQIDKIFRASDNKTVNEVRSEAPAEFMDAWLAKNEGKDKDMTAGKVTGTPGAPTVASGAPTKPLF